MGEYFRQYFFAGDRDEMPFNRATRGWVYRLAKNEGGIIGFGSTSTCASRARSSSSTIRSRCWRRSGCRRRRSMIGEGYCKHPFEARSIVNISGMSFGAISAARGAALSRGAAVAGCWMDTGEGGLSPYHLEGGCDVIMQIGTAKYGVRDCDGQASRRSALRELAQQVKAFEIKLSQGAKPGKGGVLPGGKVTAEIARDPRHSGGPRLDQPQPASRHRQHGRAAGPNRLHPRPHRAAGRRQDRDRRLALHATSCAMRYCGAAWSARRISS